MDEETKKHMTAHKVAFTVAWDLPREEFGSTDHMTTDPATAQRFVTERLASGLPVEVELLSDEHHFDDGMVGSVYRACEREPWEVLRELADQLEAEAETCEP